MKKTYSTAADLESELAAGSGDQHYVLTLYVTGMTQRSTEAFAKIKSICEQHLKGRYELEVVDIYKHPSQAREEQIVAAPTLVRKLLSPLRKLVGNLAEHDRVLLALDIRKDETK